MANLTITNIKSERDCLQGSELGYRQSIDKKYIPVKKLGTIYFFFALPPFFTFFATKSYLVLFY
jgi:hypothetical protein